MRAISSFLFGIPERTADAHRHEMAKLMIGAVVEAANGERLSLTRKKGRKDTLRDAAGAPVPEDHLSTLLAGVHREAFEQTFGLDHERLREGGRELLSQGGGLAENLFGAALGAGVRDVAEELSAEAEELWVPRGWSGKRKLNQALQQHRDAKAEARRLALRPEDFIEKDRQLADLRQERAAAAEQRLRTERERGELDRRARLLPLLAELEVERARRAAIGAVPPIAPDARTRRERAEQDVAKATVRIEPFREGHRGC